MELEQVMQALRAADQRARDGDAQAAADARRLAQIAQRLSAQQPAQRRDPALSQVNLGIADAVGGLADLINPLDTPAVSEALGFGDRLSTGSARDALVGGMQSTGMAGEDRPPEGVGEAFLRGSGQAAGAVIPTAGAATALSRAPGMIGQGAETIRRGLTSAPAVAVEAAAGGVSGAAMEGTEQALEGSDLPEWAQDMLVTTAGIAAPTVALPAATYVAGQAGGAVRNFSPAVNAYRATAGAVAPYTRSGADALARRRLEELSGSRERALELGERINPNNEFGLTPAQQTGDPRMIALEQAAREGNPVLDERLSGRLNASIAATRGAVDEVGGNVADAQGFFREARARYTTEMRQVAEQALRNAEARLSRISADRRPSENSSIVMREVEAARDLARQRERELWFAVPVTRQVGTSNARDVAATILDETGEELRSDIPEAVFRRLLNDDTAYTEGTTVRNLHALYSRLRQVAREASAGQAPNENRARIANAVADAILEDMAASGVREIDDARAFSRALHETFDRGAYGRLSRQTIQGDTVTDPRVALDRSVGRGDTGAMVDAENLEAAASGLAPSGAPGRPNEPARSAIVDYVRGRFEDSAFTPDAQGRMVVNPRTAAQFIRNNRELLERYPELRGEILEAGRQQQDAETLAAAIEQRIVAVENGRTNPVSGFADATQETAIRSIIDAENPARAAQAVLSQARRDPTGAALEGVKGVFSDELIRRATTPGRGLDATRMADLMRDSRFMTAMTRILEPDEIRRLQEIIRNVERLNMAQTSQGALPGESLSGASPPRILDAMVRIIAVNNAPTSGQSAGASLQTANIVSSNARNLLGRLTADRASQILADAVEDPRLFQALLMDPASPRFERDAMPRLIPYLIGGTAAAVTPDE